MSDFEENDDFMCDDEEDYGLVSRKKSKKIERTKECHWERGDSVS